jgi:plasmid maintenance system antidote protein VapI
MIINDAFIRRYGMTLRKLAERLGFSEEYLKTLKPGEIHNLIIEHEKFYQEPVGK